MNNSIEVDFYFGISDNKIYISFFDKIKNNLRNTVSFQIPDNLNNDLNFKIILNLLQKNIKKIEKELGSFLNSGYISIYSKTYQKILISIKNIFDEKKLDKEVITNLVQRSLQQFNINNNKLTIVHIIINKYIIDDKIYNFFPGHIQFKKIILELEFICLDKNLVNKIKKLFKDCKVHINKIISFQYSQKLFKHNCEDVTMCISARRLINETNKSEVHINENSPRNPVLFDKIFNLFD